MYKSHFVHFIISLAIIFAINSLTYARDLPDSPCPDIFGYRRNSTSGEWYGKGHIERDPVENTTSLYVYLIANLPTDYNFDKQGSLEITQKGNILAFNVFFPIQTPLPEVRFIVFNERTICSRLTKTDPNWKTIRLFKAHDTLMRNGTEFSSSKESSSQNAPEGRLDSHTQTAQTAVQCGTVDPMVQLTPLVAQGQTIQRGTWPWLVAIYRHIGFAVSFICGGSLISNRLVVTAAHCFSAPRLLKVEDIALILGKFSLRKLDEEGTKIIYPSSLNIHPQYNTSYHAPDADIAVVVTAEPVKFTEFIRPICLWNVSDTTDIVKSVGLTAGWGMDELGNRFTDLPRTVRIPVVDNSECRSSSQLHTLLLTDRTFCAGWKNGTDGVCQGDSGGGYALEIAGRWTLRGLVSTSPYASPGRCDLSHYIIFVDIIKFIDWIKSHDPETEA